MFQISDLQERYNMSTGEIEDLLNQNDSDGEAFDEMREDCIGFNEDELWKEMAEIADEVHAESLAEKQMERAEEIRDERREDGISDQN